MSDPLPSASTDDASLVSRPDRPRRIPKVSVWLCLAGVVGFMVLGNIVIAGASVWARSTTPAPAGPDVSGVGNFRVVDARLWRGAAPSFRGYESLAAAGAGTVIDLRAEENIHIDEDRLHWLGLERVAIPIRDGQTPTPAEIRQFMAAVAASQGPVFVHCGAGVGRTGTMVAAYLVANGQSDEWTAMRRNLAVGPPSLEQLAFVAGLDDGDRPGTVLTAVSRILDAPRRIWSGLRQRRRPPVSPGRKPSAR